MKLLLLAGYRHHHRAKRRHNSRSPSVRPETLSHKTPGFKLTRQQTIKIQRHPQHPTALNVQRRSDSSARRQDHRLQEPQHSPRRAHRGQDIRRGVKVHNRHQREPRLRARRQAYHTSQHRRRSINPPPPPLFTLSPQATCKLTDSGQTSPKTRSRGGNRGRTSATTSTTASTSSHGRSTPRSRTACGANTAPTPSPPTTRR